MQAEAHSKNVRKPLYLESIFKSALLIHFTEYLVTVQLKSNYPHAILQETKFNSFSTDLGIRYAAQSHH